MLCRDLNALIIVTSSPDQINNGLGKVTNPKEYVHQLFCWLPFPEFKCSWNPSAPQSIYALSPIAIASFHLENVSWLIEKVPMILKMTVISSLGTSYCNCLSFSPHRPQFQAWKVLSCQDPLLKEFSWVHKCIGKIWHGNRWLIPFITYHVLQHGRWLCAIHSTVMASYKVWTMFIGSNLLCDVNHLLHGLQFIN